MEGTQMARPAPSWISNLGALPKYDSNLELVFTPATWAVIAGLLVLAFAVFQPNIIILLVVVFILFLSVLYYKNFRPVLGTDG
jgi:hypothetical protein